MSRAKTILFMCFLLLPILGCTKSSTLPKKTSISRPAIVLVAFGTTRSVAQATYKNIETAYRSAFPDHEIRWAFTSETIRRKLLAEGKAIYSPAEIIQSLHRDGYNQAVFQSLHIVPGQEYTELKALHNDSLHIAYGAPLLFNETDLNKVSADLHQTFSENEVTIYVAHGNDAHPQYNSALISLASRLEKVPGQFLCTVEGSPPGVNGLMRAKEIAAKNVDSVNIAFVPLMLVSGVHIRDDVLGDHPNSWLNRIGAARYTVASPIGERETMVNIFIEHTNKALSTLTPPVVSTSEGHPTSGLGFFLSKTKLLLKLCLYIIAGVFLANILEVASVSKHLAFLAWPITRLGRLDPSTSTAFLAAFQSGAVANSILVTNRDTGKIDNRQLYTSVLVVSCLSLFAHLPTYILPIGSVLGLEATVALFVTRLVAILLEIAIVLIAGTFISNQLQKRIDKAADVKGVTNIKPVAHTKQKTRRISSSSFVIEVWHRSKKTLVRLLAYVAPTFAVMGAIEYMGLFSKLSKVVPGIFALDFLPAQSTIIIPAQAISLYNGAIAAAGFVDNGSIQVKQAVVIILIGSIITAPIRTLKHALPTYIAILGTRTGIVLSVSAQVLRSIFLMVATIGMWLLW